MDRLSASYGNFSVRKLPYACPEAGAPPHFPAKVTAPFCQSWRAATPRTRGGRELSNLPPKASNPNRKRNQNEANTQRSQGFKWCPEPESNQRHADFQSAALPTELSGRRWWGGNRQSCGGCPEAFAGILRLGENQCRNRGLRSLPASPSEDRSSVSPSRPGRT